MRVVPLKKRWGGLDLTPLAHESETSCLLRFMWRNSLNHSLLNGQFGFNRNYLNLARAELERHTGWTLLDDQPWDFGLKNSPNAECWFTNRFRYCALCLECGYHSELFQCLAMASCPFHEIALSDRCHQCGEITPRLSDAKLLFANPYHCHKCFGPLCGVCPDLGIHLDFRLDFAAFEAALVPYYRWWHESESTRYDVYDLRSKQPASSHEKWCSVPELSRALTYLRNPAPKCFARSHYPPESIVELVWRSQLLAGVIHYAEGRQRFRDRVRTGERVYRSTLAQLASWIAREEGWSLAEFGIRTATFKSSLASKFSVRFLAFMVFRCHVEQCMDSRGNIELCPHDQVSVNLHSLGATSRYEGRASRLEFKAIFLALYAAWHSRLQLDRDVVGELRPQDFGDYRSHILIRSRTVVQTRILRGRGRRSKYSEEAWFEGEVVFLRIQGMPITPWQ